MFERMTMEETFIVSYAIGVLVGVLIAIPTYFIFKKEGKNNE